MRIGIFGGSFNPPHQMHKDIAIFLIDNKQLDQIIYVPVGNLFNKSGLAPCEDRYNMLKLMIEGYDNLSVSDYEFNSLTYTYQTLTYYKNLYPNDEIYFICGSDNLREFSTWKEYEYILSNFKILVTNRNHDDIDSLKQQYNKYLNNITFISISPSPLSSTEVRNSIKENKSLKGKIDKKIEKYINDKNLYK